MLSWPALALPKTADIGEGTMNCCCASKPRQVDLGRVSQRFLVMPTHNSGSPRYRRSMISSVCGSSPVNLIGESDSRSESFGPLDVMLLIRSSLRGGHGLTL